MNRTAQCYQRAHTSLTTSSIWGTGTLHCAHIVISVCTRSCPCVCGCAHTCIWIYLFIPFSCFLYSHCSWFEAVEARKLRVAVGSFLDLTELTTDTMDQFGWLLYCVYTPALWHGFVQFVMHSYCIVAVLSALHMVNMYAMLWSQCTCTWMVYRLMDYFSLMNHAPLPLPNDCSHPIVRRWHALANYELQTWTRGTML